MSHLWIYKERSSRKGSPEKLENTVGTTIRITIFFLKNLLSGKIERLTNSGYDAEASYSPDGQKILFSSNRHVYNSHLSPGLQKELETNPSSFNELYIMDSSGENIQRLTTVKGYDGGPFFNSDGDEICWRRFSPRDTAEIFSMNLNRLKTEAINEIRFDVLGTFFHPSNQYLIFSTNIHGFGNFELYIVDKDGKKDPIRVTERDGFDGLPTFSPMAEQFHGQATKHHPATPNFHCNLES